MNNPAFLPYLCEGLLLDESHPRQEMAEEKRRWLQTMHVNCFAQICVCPAGREALLSASDYSSLVQSSLHTLAEGGPAVLSEEVREVATVALRALEDRQLEMDDASSAKQLHVMLSCEFSCCLSQACLGASSFLVGKLVANSRK